MTGEMHVSLVADITDLVGRMDTTTAATQILLRPDTTLVQLDAAKNEIRIMLEDSQEEWLTARLRLANEALSIAESIRSRQ